MEICEVPGRDSALLGQLLELWERSVQASHTFLSPAEISAIRECVPDALAGVAHLVIARDQAGLMGFLGRREVGWRCCSWSRSPGTGVSVRPWSDTPSPHMA